MASNGTDNAASKQGGKVLVVGSINTDLYQTMKGDKVKVEGKELDISSMIGMTLPSSSYFNHASMKAKLEAADLKCEAGKEDALAQKIDGPWTQVTGGKGANAAAACAQTGACEFVGQFGEDTAEANKGLLADFKKYGGVETGRIRTVAGPTGIALIFLSEESGDNSIILIGGANMAWPDAAALESGKEGEGMRQAISDCVAVMLQREIPAHVNLVAAKLAHAAGKPVIMDVGGSDAPVDEALMRYISVIAPNESELTFISGLETQRDGEVSRSLVRKAVTQLKSKFAKAGNESVEVLVTLGAMGSMYFGKSEGSTVGLDDESPEPHPHEIHMGRFTLNPRKAPGGKPVDTTGAGDCFRGSFVAARYGEGKTIKEALRWAAAAGSLAVEVKGTMASMPSRKAIEGRVSRLMEGETQPLKAPKFLKVSAIKPDGKGLNLQLKCVSGDMEEVVSKGEGFKEVVLGDDTGVVTLSLRADASALKTGLIAADKSLRLQNGHIKMTDGHMRLVVDKWGCIKEAEEALSFEVKTSNDISAVEYELRS
eukprot:TRINITY_DN2444_c0_g1_i1.p1 TRINITY_DN2444_c0_g1~~TRINITY_DN2444_c0_g1_i1.p1  ORF type:complete len:541 (+),score=143.33 TRINITY_DN2444_c0_g1_i1:126-1748(+)